MATVSSRELEALRDQVKAVLDSIQNLLTIQAREEKAASRFGEPAGRQTRKR